MLGGIKVDRLFVKILKPNRLKAGILKIKENFIERSVLWHG